QAQPAADGTWAGVQGTVEVQHDGAWQPANVGAALFGGDHVRAAAQSRATLVLHDDAVVDVAPGTELGIDAQEGDESGRALSRLHLTAGKVRVWAAAVSRETRSSYEVNTPSAVVAGRGAEFIVVYDGATETTTVL